MYLPFVMCKVVNAGKNTPRFQTGFQLPASQSSAQSRLVLYIWNNNKILARANKFRSSVQSRKVQKNKSTLAEKQDKIAKRIVSHRLSQPLNVNGQVMDTSNPNPKDEWNDEQLEAALKRLDELHRQVWCIQRLLLRYWADGIRTSCERFEARFRA